MARRPHETSSPRSEGSEPDEAAPCAEVASDVAVAVSPEGAELSSPYPPPNPPPVGRPVRIYADGIFDLFHFGHARALEQAKKSFPSVYLIVGVCDDATTHAYKGKTVMTETERYEALRHCRWVDEVVQSAPWVVTPAFLEAHSIDYVAHDALPYADASGQSDDVYGPVKLMGRFWETKRTEGVSTSDLILRIVRDYNDYVLRNLSRGYTREQLGLSLLQEQRIRAKERVKSISKTFRGIADPSARRAAAEELRKKLATRVDRNVAGLARNVEGLVDRVASGALGEELAGTTDRLLSGFVASFERTYSKIERSIKARLGKRARNGAPRAPGRSGGAASDATLSESSSPGRDAVTTADEDDDDADDDGFVDLDDETKRAGSPRRRSHRHPRSGGGANAFQHALWGGRVRRSESATSLEASSPGETSRSDDDQVLGDDATKPHEKHAANSPTRNAADGPATRGKSARLESDENDDDDDDHDENDDASRAKAAKRLKAAQTKGGRAAPKAPRAVAAV